MSASLSRREGFRRTFASCFEVIQVRRGTVSCGWVCWWCVAQPRCGVPVALTWVLAVYGGSVVCGLAGLVGVLPAAFQVEEFGFDLRGDVPGPPPF